MLGMSDYIPIDVLGIYSKLLSHKIGFNVFVTIYGSNVMVKLKTSPDKIQEIIDFLKLDYISKTYYNKDVFIKFKTTNEFERSIIEEVQTYKILE